LMKASTSSDLSSCGASCLTTSDRREYRLSARLPRVRNRKPGTQFDVLTLTLRLRRIDTEKDYRMMLQSHL
jgi:hypothetical protein